MFTETIFETVTPNTTAEDFAMLKEAQIVALHYIGESCSEGQKGHEAHDDQNRILRCDEVSTGVFKWVDTGRTL